MFDLQECMVGDFNARTGVLQDTDDYDDTAARICGLDNIDTADHIQRGLHNFHYDRNNQDKKVNNSGRMLIELCKFFNLCLANGRIGNEGDFTCIVPLTML